MMPLNSTTVRWLIVAPASVALGWLLNFLGIPAAWIVGAILVSGTMALTTAQPLPVNDGFYRFGRGIIMVIAAVPLTTIGVRDMLIYLPPGLFISVFTVGVGLIGGILLSRSQPRHISQDTGILSMLPGGASVISVLAIEFGANYRYVMLTQFLRVLILSLSLPLIVHLAMGSTLASTETSPTSDWWVVAIIIGIALVAEPLARKIKLPAPTVLGPMLATIALATALPEDVVINPPSFLSIFAFLAIGWVCGGALQRDTLALFSKQLPATLAFIAILMGVCAISAWALVPWLDINYFEAYLATSPGAIETVLALAAEGNAGPEVVAMQIIRLLCVLALASWLPHIIRALARFSRD